MRDRQVLVDDQSERSNQGADAEVTDALEALNDPTGSSLKVKTSRRVFLPPRLQHQIVYGNRTNFPRRSNRLKTSVVSESSPHEELSPNQSGSTEEESLTSTVKSLNDTLELHMTDLVEGHMYSKDKFIDVENDTDNIVDFIDETPYDKLFTSATIAQHGSEEAPSSSSQYKKIDEIIQRVDDVEMKELLKKWIYKYTNVFNDELNDKPARVKPFELHEKPNSNWNKLAANKGQPR